MFPSKVGNDLRAVSDDARWAILRKLDALARAGMGSEKRTNHMTQLSVAGPAELRTAAALAAATLDRVLGASVTALLDRMPAKLRIVSPQEPAVRLIGDDVTPDHPADHPRGCRPHTRPRRS